MTVTSSRTAAARPKPRNCTASVRAKANAPKTRIMTSAAEVMVEPVVHRASEVATSLSCVRSKHSFIRVSRNTS